LCIWGPVLGELGELRRGIEVEQAALAAFADDPRLSGACWAYLAQLHLKAGEIKEAHAAAERAESLLEPFPPLFGLALAALGRAALARSDSATMVDVERRAAELFEAGTEFEEGRALLQLVCCELCEALGYTEKALALAAHAASELEQRARAIASEPARKRFLTQVTEHCALIERAATGRLRSSASSSDTARSGS
ncbi:MAG: hypothetical protein KC492_43000, partial [Myxococcales bacterium]|nr:hypothetical protein [Myxococcales bacterium]